MEETDEPMTHKGLTYYIEKVNTINEYGEIAHSAFYLKRRCVWFGITVPFWKYIMENNYYGELRRDFYTKDIAEKFFTNHICRVVTDRYKKSEIVETLKC